jgi:hypothetical protein
MNMIHILKKRLKNIHMFGHKDLTSEMKERRLRLIPIFAGTSRKRKRENRLRTF